MRKCNDAMTKTAVAGAYIVDSLPFLNYLPEFLAPWKSEANKIYSDTLALFSRHVNDVRNDIKEGKDVHCFARYILESQKSCNLSDEQADFLAGAMFGAGADTSSDQISTFILSMVAHPHVSDQYFLSSPAHSFELTFSSPH